MTVNLVQTDRQTECDGMDCNLSATKNITTKHAKRPLAGLWGDQGVLLTAPETRVCYWQHRRPGCVIDSTGDQGVLLTAQETRECYWQHRRPGCVIDSTGDQGVLLTAQETRECYWQHWRPGCVIDSTGDQGVLLTAQETRVCYWQHRRPGCVIDSTGDQGVLLTAQETRVCYWQHRETRVCVVSYLKFLLFLLNKLSFSDTTVIEGGREGKHRWDLKSFILGDTLQLITPLPRTGMFSKIWRAILVEVAGPKAPHWMNPPHLTSPLNNHIFLQNSTLKRACPIIDWWSEIFKLLL